MYLLHAARSIDVESFKLLQVHLVFRQMQAGNFQCKQVIVLYRLGLGLRKLQEN